MACIPLNNICDCSTNSIKDTFARFNKFSSHCDIFHEFHMGAAILDDRMCLDSPRAQVWHFERNYARVPHSISTSRGSVGLGIGPLEKACFDRFMNLRSNKGENGLIFPKFSESPVGSRPCSVLALHSDDGGESRQDHHQSRPL